MADSIIVNGATLDQDGNTIHVSETIPQAGKDEVLSLNSLKSEVDQLHVTINTAQSRLDFIESIFALIGVTYP